jgi:UDP-N-acetylglucosamine 2-epimerase (non-hydrolysing)
MTRRTALAPGSVAVVFGTRPEVVKLADVVHGLGDAARTVHSGQHFSPALARDFLDELGLDAPRVQLAIGGASRGRQVGEATMRLDEHLAVAAPRVVVVQGDTNTALAGALAANAREIPLVHVEAGLRSFDRDMPEEHNRVVVDHLADLCCAPTETSRANLAAEGIAGDRVVVTGNTVVDAVIRLLPAPDDRAELLAQRDLEPGRFVLSTFHRPENVDERDALATILEQLARLPLPVLLPLHPRTVERVEQFGLRDRLANLRVVEPLGYREFIALSAECALLVSDSGGIQEEASVLKRPVVVVRNSTERPEVVGTFAELVSGPAIAERCAAWLADVGDTHRRLAVLASPYGDGTAARQSVEAIRRLLEART